MVERGRESEEMGMEKENEKEKEKEKKGVVRDDICLPRMVVRVLLVEADDCTRRILTALLRKCSYRVAAVDDGLKAWEMLKGRPHNVDLILTEVELPSISGYALLSLIMEHDVCKSLPVIMMSSKDSMSLVMKCMLKGAADFLTKPVRKNELKNLWQHVWRRKLVENVRKCKMTCEKDKAAFEDNVANNHCRDNLASPGRDKHSNEKYSDSQSSCGKPNLEAETTTIPNYLLKVHMKSENASTICDTGVNEECSKMVDVSEVPKSDPGGNVQYGEDALHHGSQMLVMTGMRDHACMKSRADIKSQPDTLDEQAQFNRESNWHISGHTQPAGGAIDIIGKFEACTQDIDGHFQAKVSPKKVDVMPKLEMTLRRMHHSFTTDEQTDHGTLHPSKTSAFSRYDNNRALRPPFPKSTSYQNDGANSSHQPFANQLAFHSSPGHSLAPSQEYMTPVVLGQYGQPEEKFPGAYIGFVPIPNISFDSAYSGYGNQRPPVYYMQPSFSPFWGQKPHYEEPPLPTSSSIHSCSEVSNPEDAFHLNYEQTHHSANRSVLTDDIRLEMGKMIQDGSPALGLSNDFNSKVSSTVTAMLCGTSEGNHHPAATVAAARPTESVNDNGQLDYNGPQGKDSQCTSQREAALLKFRMKRKDRCYQKKVRYQSRKRLAEQRPRVKGQFARQVPDETAPLDAVHGP